ncbi:TRAP transporter substrate-binding protein [Eoetvoesiella caeni]|uniref:TRAP-type C4-dicarboxylate transport system substrate-binding protein n=1 Tax=Eoetvoesiella caeni TaxID=645616 RepID=A0A366HMB1_9BURK|nr:TRAP transporter substrate-binding protein [Eoetvoesiella caeni]MCI2807497.1 TRAP transporter substrate-binding protein [Eoetvoesiella caeni]NYT53108.1 TRAP transporter substrate-binding protein [Eoetvoesiella caeni]RBP43085.1 TRAP-type C4-dicarboxylate transport system substrate-binding protein [Eoetvoesiella caeni]
MNSIRITRRKVLSAFAAAALACTASMASAEPVKLKLSSFESPLGNITANVLTPFARDASAASQGTLQIDVFAGGTLGRSPAQQLKLVTDGIADFAWVVLPYTPGRFDDAEVVGQPFLITSSTEASITLQRMYDKGQLAGFDGLKMLVLGATPPVTIHSTKPVHVPSDLKGKRVRISGSLPTKLVESLGGAPVQVGGGQIGDALSRGVVDMTFNNWGFVSDFKIDEVTSQHVDIPLGAVAVGIVMRQDRYDSLPEQARAALDKVSGEKLAYKLGQAFDTQDEDVRKRIAKSKRNTIINPSAQEIALWHQAVEPVNAAWRVAIPRNEQINKEFSVALEQVRKDLQDKKVAQ